MEGWDIPAPGGMLKITEADAFVEVVPIPYAFATNLQHAVLWQRFWLRKIAGGRKKSGMQEWKNDFRVPEPREFKDLRREFLEGLAEARGIAASEPSDPEVVESLVRIAVHAAYHLGQMNLIKRSVRKAKTPPLHSGGEGAGG